MTFRLAHTHFVLTGLLLALLFSSGCSLLPEEKDETLNWSANKFYSEASSALRAGDYKTATGYYEKLEAAWGWWVVSSWPGLRRRR